MDGAIVIRWGTPIPGREAKGLEVLAQAQQTFDDLAKAGRIREHREYFAVSGADEGFMIIDGEVEQLSALLHDPQQLALAAQANSVVNGFSRELLGGGTERGVQDMVGVYLGALQQVGYL